MEGTLHNWISHIPAKGRIAGSNVFIVHFFAPKKKKKKYNLVNNGMHAQKPFFTLYL